MMHLFKLTQIIIISCFFLYSCEAGKSTPRKTEKMELRQLVQKSEQPNPETVQPKTIKKNILKSLVIAPSNPNLRFIVENDSNKKSFTYSSNNRFGLDWEIDSGLVFIKQLTAFNRELYTVIAVLSLKDWNIVHAKWETEEVDLTQL